MEIKERVSKLRALMERNGIDVYMIPTADFHNSEYVGEHFKARAFMSGFTGSAGTLIVTKDFAGLWTDGRYFLQGEKQLEGTGIELQKMREPGVPTIAEFVVENTPENGILGFDGRVVVAVATAAHRRAHVKLADECLISQRTILRPTVAMMNQARRRSSGCDSAKQCLHDQIFRHTFAHRIADDFAAVQILQAGKIQPALVGRDIGDVTAPGLIGRGH